MIILSQKDKLMRRVAAIVSLIACLAIVVVLSSVAAYYAQANTVRTCSVLPDAMLLEKVFDLPLPASTSVHNAAIAGPRKPSFFCKLNIDTLDKEVLLRELPSRGWIAQDTRNKPRVGTVKWFVFDKKDIVSSFVREDGSELLVCKHVTLDKLVIFVERTSFQKQLPYELRKLCGDP